MFSAVLCCSLLFSAEVTPYFLISSIDIININSITAFYIRRRRKITA